MFELVTSQSVQSQTLKEVRLAPYDTNICSLTLVDADGELIIISVK